MLIKIKQISLRTSLYNSIQYMVFMVGLYLLFWLLWDAGYKLGMNLWPPTLNEMASVAQIVIAYSTIFAIGQYAVTYADISDRKTKNVLEFVKFFRENVIYAGDKIKLQIKKDKINIPTINFRKNTPPPEFTEVEFFNKIAPNQNSGLVQDYRKIIFDHSEIEEIVRSALNSMEEFSIGILNSNSQDHQAVSSIKKPFVEMAESLAVPIYFYIGITADKFSYISKLYGYWKSDVGFIPRSEEDVAERFKVRQKKFKKS